MTTTQLLFVQCACNSPAVWSIRGKDIQDDVCEACYQRYYVDDDQSSGSWEAEPLPTCCHFDAPCTAHREMNAQLRTAFGVAPLAPHACVWCSSTSHAPGKCPTAAALSGPTLIAGLRAELAAACAKLDKQDKLIAELHEELNDSHLRLTEYRSVNALATAALEKYAAKFGPLSE